MADEKLESLLSRFRKVVSERHMSAAEIKEATGLNRETASQLKWGKVLRLHPPNIRKIEAFLATVDQESSRISRETPSISRHRSDIQIRDADVTYEINIAGVPERERVDALMQMFDSGAMLRRMAQKIPPKDLYLMAMDLAIELNYSEEELDRIHEWGKQLLKDAQDSG